MVKLLFLPLLIGSFSLLSTPKNSDQPNYRSYLVTEENARGKYTVTGIKTQYLSSDNVRIYQFDDELIDEIADTAFVGTSFTTVVISKNITHINSAVFENATNIKTINYTGSIAEFSALNLSFDVNNVHEYAVDEGFINFWNTYVRVDANSNICDISVETYKQLDSLYKNLIKSDLEVVNSYTDSANAKIGESMKEIYSVFNTDNSQQRKDEWNQTGAITLIIVIAVIGMTSITIFYLLKTKNIIH